MKKIALLSATILLLFFFGCKKVDNNLQKGRVTQQFQDNALAKLRLAVANNPSLKRITVPVNEKVEGYFADSSLKRITSKSIKGSPNSRVYQCADPVDMDYPPSSTLKSYTYEYDCNLGYKFTFNWEVSISVNLLTVQGSYVAKGRVRVIGNGVSVYSDLNLTSITLTNLGDDPGTLNQNVIYEVEYETDWINAGYFGDIYAPESLQTSFVAPTDCIDIPNYVTGYKTVAFDGTKSCTRIDPLAIIPAEKDLQGNYIDHGIIMGFGNIVYLDGCPTPPNYSDRYEVEIKYDMPGHYFLPIKPELGTWPGDVLTNGYLNPFNSLTDNGTIGLYDVYYIPKRDMAIDLNSGDVIHGSYLIHYRNFMYDGCKGPWSEDFPVEL